MNTDDDMQTIVVGVIEFRLPRQAEDATTVDIYNLQMREGGCSENGYLGTVTLGDLRSVVALTFGPDPAPPARYTYPYFASELAVFLNLVRNEETSHDDLRAAFQGLGYVYTHTAEPTGQLDRLNFHKGFELATRRMVARLAGDPLPPAPGSRRT